MNAVTDEIDKRIRATPTAFLLAQFIRIRNELLQRPDGASSVRAIEEQRPATSLSDSPGENSI